jgi:hypothetical protein
MVFSIRVPVKGEMKRETKHAKRNETKHHYRLVTIRCTFHTRSVLYGLYRIIEDINYCIFGLNCTRGTELPSAD